MAQELFRAREQAVTAARSDIFGNGKSSNAVCSDGEWMTGMDCRGDWCDDSAQSVSLPTLAPSTASGPRSTPKRAAPTMHRWGDICVVSTVREHTATAGPRADLTPASRGRGFDGL